MSDHDELANTTTLRDTAGRAATAATAAIRPVATGPSARGEHQAAKLRVHDSVTMSVQCPRCLAGVGNRCRGNDGDTLQRAHLPRQARAVATLDVNRQADMVTDAAAMTAPCVVCRALIGRACRQSNGRPAPRTHHARRAAVLTQLMRTI